MKSYLILIVFWFISLFSPTTKAAKQVKAPPAVAKKAVTLTLNPIAPVRADVPVIPQELIIPAIGLDTKILQVDLNSQRLVDVPPADVGWYMGSAKPGNPGNAVLQGHVKNFDLSPGIFSRLAEVQPGDDIYTVDSAGKKVHFKVAVNDLVDAAAFPVEKVYGATGDTHLNLITCAGSYDAQKQDYTMRTVIYAQLVNEK